MPAGASATSPSVVSHLSLWYAPLIREEVTPRLVERWEIRKADKEARLAALDALEYIVEKLDWATILRYIRSATGGLGDREDEPLDPFRMGLAGSVIAWPEVLQQGSRVLEIGTGLGRTRYAIAVCTKTSIYLSIDIDPIMLAIALYRNPIEAYMEPLWSSTYILLGDAIRIVPLIARVKQHYFDHIVHDGGPNPRRNPKLYSRSVFEAIRRLLKPCGTLSVFAGAERRWRTKIYETLISLGFHVVETVHLPGSKAAVIHARLPGETCSGESARHER